MEIVILIMVLVALAAGFIYFRGPSILPKMGAIGQNLQPHEGARQFFSSIMDSQCHISWALFSKASQKNFSEWALHEIYTRNKESAVEANIGIDEIKLMFENNDSQILKYFWRRFFFSSGAGEIFRFGYFSTVQIQGNQSIVKVTLQYPNGQTREIGLPMVKEAGVWCMAYVEHNLPF